MYIDVCRDMTSLDFIKMLVGERRIYVMIKDLPFMKGGLEKQPFLAGERRVINILKQDPRDLSPVSSSLARRHRI